MTEPPESRAVRRDLSRTPSRRRSPMTAGPAGVRRVLGAASPSWPRLQDSENEDDDQDDDDEPDDADAGAECEDFQETYLQVVDVSG